MAFQNNNEQPKEVTTRGFKTFNSGAKKATAFEWDYQGDMLKILIAPELPEAEQTERRRYDYQKQWVTCITRVKCIDLWESFKEKMLPAMKERKTKSVSVPVGEVNVFTIGVRTNDKGGFDAYARLTKNLDTTTLKSSEVIEYEFRKGEIIEDYDNSTGKFENREITANEFLLFISDLQSFICGSSKAFNHANRCVDKTYKDMIVTDIRAIGNKVGAEMSTPYASQRGGARYGQASLFDTGAMNAPADQITTLDDLNIEYEGEQ